MEQCEVPGSWWKTLHKPKPYAFAILIIAGLFLEIFVHYYFQIAVVYTHFYYLIIVLAGLWYGKKAIWIALFFGGLHIVVSYILLGILSPDALIRALMFVIVAFVVGTIVDQRDCYHATVIEQNLKLTEINARLESSHKAFETANKKLRLLSSITRHDIRNQLMAILGFIELSKEKTTDPELLHFIEREETAASTINRQIDFTKNYEEIGVHVPQWQNIGMRVRALQTVTCDLPIEISPALDKIEIFADPMLEKVFLNLIDNSRRHGERVTHISFSVTQCNQEDVAIVYEDDGIGVQESDKEQIFTKGFGKNTGLGLFLSREILSITGLTMKETGIYGKGARFEIVVPQGKYRSTTSNSL